MIVREGYPFVLASGIMTLPLAVLWRPWGVLFLLIPLYVSWFFRNPPRKIPTEGGLVLSPADGKILKVEEVEESRYLKRRTKKVSIFMSPLDVHVNRIPASGRVKEIFYNPGKYFSAFREKASLDNEQNAVLMETTGGDEILFVQIAGWLARRIVCDLKKGDAVAAGERYGLIRFGSRLDIYLPLKVQVLVREGERARGGETVLGRFP